MKKRLFIILSLLAGLFTCVSCEKEEDIESDPVEEYNYKMDELEMGLFQEGVFDPSKISQYYMLNALDIYNGRRAYSEKNTETGKYDVFSGEEGAKMYLQSVNRPDLIKLLKLE